MTDYRWSGRRHVSKCMQCYNLNNSCLILFVGRAEMHRDKVMEFWL